MSGTDVTPWREAVALTPSVDEVALERRAARLRTRSIKTSSKQALLDLTVRCIDLTTLEGMDTPGKVRSLAAKAVHPDPTDPDVPSVAAVCVYPARVPDAVAVCQGTGVAVASVAGSFPAGLSAFEVQVEDIRRAVELGADEIDIVLNRGAFLAGDLSRCFDEIVAALEACARPDGTAAHLKVILETGELGSWDNVRRASALAIASGAEFIKTSTGKISPASTHATALCMAEAIRDEHARTGHRCGIKLAGGIRTAKDAWHYAVVIGETLGEQWLTPDLYRLGASSLLDDVLLQRRKLRDGAYPGRRDVTVA